MKYKALSMSRINFINKIKVIAALARGFLFSLRLRECGRKLLVSKGLEYNIKNADICIGDNVRFYGNVKLSVVGGVSLTIGLQSYRLVVKSLLERNCSVNPVIAV